ncbi:MAG: hypothetical protein U0805_06160 [Pirellulales bacterium]
MLPKLNRRGAARMPVMTTILFVFIVVVAGIFFFIKFYDLVLVAEYDPDGAFAVTPIVNYLMAGVGFLFMFGWAAMNGMFHDIEQPKRTMLENEQRLDAAGKPFSIWEEK